MIDHETHEPLPDCDCQACATAERDRLRLIVARGAPLESDVYSSREWVESEESARGSTLQAVLADCRATVVWHTKRPATSNPVWEVRTVPASAAAPGEVREVADSADLLKKESEDAHNR